MQGALAKEIIRASRGLTLSRVVLVGGGLVDERVRYRIIWREIFLLVLVGHSSWFLLRIHIRGEELINNYFVSTPKF